MPRQHIDEKIDRLIEFNQKYPGLWRLSYNYPLEVSIKKYFEKEIDEQQKEELIKEIYILKQYYRYIKTRPLTDEQRKKLKKTNISIFVKDEDKENKENELLIKKFGLSEKNMEQIRRIYGNLSKFRKAYIKALIDNNIDDTISVRLRNNINLVRFFDVSSPDLLLKDFGYLNVLRKTTDNQDYLTIIDGERLEKYINDFLSKQKPEHKAIIEKRFGLNGEKRKKIEVIAKEMNLSPTRVDDVRRFMLKKMKEKMENEQFNPLDIEDSSYNEFRKIFIEKYCKMNDVFVGNQKVNKKDIQKLLDILNEYRQERAEKNEIEIEKHKKRINLIDIETPLKKLHFSFSTYNSLKRENIKTIGDLIRLNTTDFNDMNSLNELSINEIIYKIHRIGLKFNDEEYALGQFSNEDYEKIVSYNIKIMDEQTLLGLSIEKLNFSTKAYNVLSKLGIYTVNDLVNVSENSLKKMHVDSKIIQEIDEILQNTGLELKKKEKRENSAQDIGKATFSAIANTEESEKVQELLDFIRKFINPEEQQK